MGRATVLKLNKGEEPYPGYHLTSFLARGGWGEVWKAVRPDGQPCALKFLRANRDATAAVEIRALQNLRRLEHPNLVRLEQIWSCSGYLVLVMELADGSLQDLLELYYADYGQPMSQGHVCFFLTQAAAALDFLNTRQHLVDGQRFAFRHCDVKPSNLLFLGETIKVADFSLAVQTTAPMLEYRRAGTRSYCAPEVLQGWLSERSDQYSLAVTYCQLRSGQLPYPDMPSHLPRDFVRPAPDFSVLTPAEKTILTRGLALVPQDRWPSCSEMMQRLTAAQ